MTKTYFKKQSYQNDHTLKRKNKTNETRLKIRKSKRKIARKKKREKSVEKSKETISGTKTRKTRANEV